MKPIRALLAASVLAIGAPSFAAAQGEVNVYTYREHKLIQPLLDAFTKDTGIKVNVVSASSGLEQRIKTEGANSPADVLLTNDAYITAAIAVAWVATSYQQVEWQMTPMADIGAQLVRVRNAPRQHERIKVLGPNVRHFLVDRERIALVVVVPPLHASGLERDHHGLRPGLLERGLR